MKYAQLIDFYVSSTHTMRIKRPTALLVKRFIHFMTFSNRQLLRLPIIFEVEWNEYLFFRLESAVEHPEGVKRRILIHTSLFYLPIEFFFVFIRLIIFTYCTSHLVSMQRANRVARSQGAVREYVYIMLISIEIGRYRSWLPIFELISIWLRMYLTLGFLAPQ